MQSTDEETRQHMATLNDEQLSDFIAAMDATELLDHSKTFDLGKSALYYADAIGWPIFPLKPQGKKPLTAHGFKDATRDLDTIRAWWQRWPDANLGTPTGHASEGGCGYDVIDVDGTLGFTSLAAWKHDGCPEDCSAEAFCPATGSFPPVHALAFTPGDPTRTPPRGQGRHYYTPAVGTTNTTHAVPGIDLRGDGGYVVLPPSVGPSGARYSWITRP